MPLTGEGRRGVAIISEQSWMGDHWMLRRLMARSGGLDKGHFFYGDLKTPQLYQQLKQKNVTTVVGMGEKVLSQLLGEKDILRWRGRVVDWMGINFIPSIAPQDLLPRHISEEEAARLKAMGIHPLVNPPRFQGVAMLDLEYALRVAREGFTRKKANYTVDPTVEEFERYVLAYEAALALNPNLYLSWDVETVYKQKKKDEDEFEEDKLDLEPGSLLRISFSYEEYTGVSIPWAGPYLGLVQRLLASAGPKVVWNGRTFDVPVIEKVGMFCNGPLHDGMDAWKVYQSDLPKGLEFVSSFTSDMLPWKHLNNSDPGLYSAIDPDAALRNMNWIEAKLKSTGQWPLYYNLYHRVMTPLTAANKRGNFIDIAKRDELRSEMTALIESKVASIQPLVPREVKPRKVWLSPVFDDLPKFLDPMELDTMQPRFVRDGRDFDVVRVPDTVKVCSACGRIATNKSEHYANGKGPQKIDKNGNLRFGKNGNPLYESVPNTCKSAGGQIEERAGIRFEYHEVLDFNPNSGDQLKAYARFFGHPIGTDARDSTKEAFDAAHIKELLKIVKGDHVTFYEAVQEIKKLGKTLGTYIYDPDENGLIHQTYKNNPSTPRLSGANKNLMNVGKREDNYWAVRAREQIIARPGHRFVQADSSAIEAVIQGWWMGDENYMRLATQSVHAWVVAKKHGIPWVGDEEQVAFLKANFKDDYNKMKTTNYLTNFGGGPYLMWKTDRKSFPTKEIAQQTQDELFKMLPKLKEYHHAVRTRGQKEGFLEIPGWKFRHYYYDVFSTDHNGKLKLGKDAKRIVALYPQGCAALFLRENILLLAYGDEAAEWLGIEPLGLSRGYIDWMPANLAVHDGYTLEVPDGSEAEAMDVLERVLTRPIKQLGGLRVGCEIDVSPVGGNWGSYSEKKNPNGLKTVKTVRVPVVPPPNSMGMVA